MLGLLAGLFICFTGLAGLVLFVVFMLEESLLLMAVSGLLAWRQVCLFFMQLMLCGFLCNWFVVCRFLGVKVFLCSFKGRR